jgi:hypothetical protein
MSTIIDQDEINALEAEIDRLRRELDKKEAILSYLKGKTNAGTEHAVKTQENSSSLTSDMDFKFDDLIVETKPSSGPTIVDHVKGIIHKYFEDNEFSAIHVEAALLRLKLVKPNKTLRTRIATILTRLTESEFLFRTVEGKGNVPHKYRISRDTHHSAGKNGEVGVGAPTSLIN